MSCVVLFVDIRSAYYTMLRELVMPLQTSGGDIDDMIQRVGIPIAFVEPLKLLVREPCILERYVSDKHLLELISSSHVGSWFQVPGADKVARTSIGCGPGRSLADLLYNAALLPDIKRLKVGSSTTGLSLQYLRICTALFLVLRVITCNYLVSSHCSQRLLMTLRFAPPWLS